MTGYLTPREGVYLQLLATSPERPYQGLRDLKVTTSRFADLEKFSLNFHVRRSFVIRVNLLHPYPSSFLYVFF